MELLQNRVGTIVGWMYSATLRNPLLALSLLFFSSILVICISYRVAYGPPWVRLVQVALGVITLVYGWFEWILLTFAVALTSLFSPSSREFDVLPDSVRFVILSATPVGVLALGVWLSYVFIRVVLQIEEDQKRKVKGKF